MLMIDLRCRPGYERFPFRLGDDVVLKTGGPVMTVVDFDETGKVTDAWRSTTGKPSEKTAHHAQFDHWTDVN
jgi:uncharacterized protein YodC (DUF2158 family)